MFKSNQQFRGLTLYAVVTLHLVICLQIPSSALTQTAQ